MDIEEYKKLTAKPKHNKYHAKKTVCAQGHLHDSKLEAKHCGILHLLKNVPEENIWYIYVQKEFPLFVNRVFICKHIVDFFIIYKGGASKAIESKGAATAKLSDWKLKKRLFQALYPSIPYEVWDK